MTYCLKISKEYGEYVLKILKKLGLVNSSYEIVREKEYILIPLAEPKIPSSLTNINSVIVKCSPKRRNYVRTYRDFLVNKLPQKVYEKLPSSYDIVGDVVLIRLNNIPEKYWREIGNALLKFHRGKKAAYAIVGETSGKERVFPLKLIAGVHVEKTFYVEYGCKFIVYIGKVYINPSFSYEHKRISELVSDGEKVLDMFAGIGGFSIITAKYKNVEVVALDINPYAIKSINESLKINRLKGIVMPIHAESSRSERLLNRKFSRVIMNLPSLSHMFIRNAVKLISDEGGIIHYYRFSQTSTEPLHELISEVAKYGRRIVKILGVRRVIEVSPTKKLYVVDAYVM